MAAVKPVTMASIYWQPFNWNSTSSGVNRQSVIKIPPKITNAFFVRAGLSLQDGATAGFSCTVHI